MLRRLAAPKAEATQGSLTAAAVLSIQAEKCVSLPTPTRMQGPSMLPNLLAELVELPPLRGVRLAGIEELGFQHDIGQ